jgi:hypothetical protein
MSAPELIDTVKPGHTVQDWLMVERQLREEARRALEHEGKECHVTIDLYQCRPGLGA